MSSRSSTPLSSSSSGIGADQTMRVLDAVSSLFGLILLSPLFLLLAVLIKADSVGPVFFRAERVGRGGQLFRPFKFRSMVRRAAQRGPGITTANDERITRVGRLLRRGKLDELPQLLNVLKGEMSLVGPRPEDPHYVALYTPEQRRVLAVRPGITSPASLHYRHEEQLLVGPDWEKVYVEQVMPHKLQIELDYMERRTCSADLRVILETVLALFRS